MRLNPHIYVCVYIYNTQTLVRHRLLYTVQINIRLITWDNENCIHASLCRYVSTYNKSCLKM